MCVIVFEYNDPSYNEARASTIDSMDYRINLTISSFAAVAVTIKKKKESLPLYFFQKVAPIIFSALKRASGG